MPNLSRGFRMRPTRDSCRATACTHHDRTSSEPRAGAVSWARLVLATAGCQPKDRRDFGVHFSSTSAIRVCQPGPVAFQLAITSGGSRSDRSLRGCCSLGRPRRTSFSPRYKSAPAIHSSVISGSSLVAGEMRTEPFRFALMTMPHAFALRMSRPRSASVRCHFAGSHVMRMN